MYKIIKQTKNIEIPNTPKNDAPYFKHKYTFKDSIDSL